MARNENPGMRSLLKPWNFGPLDPFSAGLCMRPGAPFTGEAHGFLVKFRPRRPQFWCLVWLVIIFPIQWLYYWLYCIYYIYIYLKVYSRFSIRPKSLKLISRRISLVVLGLLMDLALPAMGRFFVFKGHHGWLMMIGFSCDLSIKTMGI